MDKISGYGYGIWLIPKSDVGAFIVDTYNPYPFKRHITVMCMMSKEMATFAYCNLLLEFSNINFKINVNSKIHNFTKSGYNTKLEISPSKCAAGVNVDILRWNEIKKNLEKFEDKGSYPAVPHMSLIYSFDDINNNILDHINKNNSIKINESFEASLHLVDISSDDPWKWKVFK